MGRWYEAGKQGILKTADYPDLLKPFKLEGKVFNDRFLMMITAQNYKMY